MWILLFFLLSIDSVQPYTMPFKTEAGCILVKQAMEYNIAKADEKSPYRNIAIPPVNCEINY